MQTSEAVLAEARSPQDDGVARAAELVGDLHIGRLILGRQAQNQPRAEDQGLRRGVGPGERLQSLLRLEVQDNHRSKWAWHVGILTTRTGRLATLT